MSIKCCLFFYTPSTEDAYLPSQGFELGIELGIELGNEALIGTLLVFRPLLMLIPLYKCLTSSGPRYKEGDENKTNHWI